MRRMIVGLAFILFSAAGMAAEDVAWHEVGATRPPSGPPGTPGEVERAERFLDEFPSSPEAPRVAFDVLMAAAVGGDKPRADEMRLLLMLEHPASLQHRYLLATSDAKTYRELLVGAGNSRDFTPEFARKFVRSVGAGSKAWTNGFLEGDEFLLQCGLAGQIAGDGRLVEYCRGQLAKTTKQDRKDRIQARQTAEILFDDSLSEAEKSLRFHAIEDKTAGKFAEHFDVRLPDDVRETAELTEARIERLLDGGRLAEASPLVASLLNAHGETPKRLFWKGWCRAAAGDRSARETWDDLVRRFPDDPWSGPAGQAAEAASALDRNLDEQAAAAAAVIRRAVATKVDLIEAQGEWTREGTDPISAYVFADISAKAAEASLRSRNHWLAAARTDGKRTSLFVVGDSAVHVFQGAIPFDVPKPVIHFDPRTREFGFAFGAEAEAKYPDGEATTEATLLVLRSLRPEILRPHFVRGLEQGRLPAAAVADEAGRTYVWLEFFARRPEVRTTEVRVTADDRLERIVGAEFVIRDLRYGPAGSFTPQPPAWPDLPVIEHETFDAAVMFRLIAAVSSLMAGQGTLAGETSGPVSP